MCLFSTLFRDASAVFVGDLVSSKRESRVVMGGAMAVSPDHSQGQSLYTCQVIRVRTLFKSDMAEVRMGSTVSVISLMPSADCSPVFEGVQVPKTQPSLWLLRTDHGILQVMTPPSPSVFPLERNLLPLEERDLQEWEDPAVAVTYLFLKPGLIIPENQYARSTRPIQMVGLGGWTSFLRVYRTAYLESNAYARGQISLVGASFEHCLAAAKRTAQDEGRLVEWMKSLPFLDSDVVRRSEDTQLKWMAWSDKESLQAAFRSPAEARDELTRWACSSLPRVKERARGLLSQYFGIDPSTLPCIPCE